jgi:hypothetical protein
VEEEGEERRISPPVFASERTKGTFALSPDLEEEGRTGGKGGREGREERERKEKARKLLRSADSFTELISATFQETQRLVPMGPSFA